MKDATMQWSDLLSTQRFKVENGKVMPLSTSLPIAATLETRSEFHIDYDRVVFSKAFRRLGRKTQVHPLSTNDHAHNRLTHSIEVASVGRSLGNMVGAKMAEKGLLPPNFTQFHIGNIIQVACLAHDLGNPPFGHTGEAALRAWFAQPEHAHYLTGLTEAEKADVQRYEGNAHSLRFLASLEMYGNAGGMRLTAASLGTLIKYPWTAATFPDKEKFNLYQTELTYYQAIAQALGLKQYSTTHWARHPLSYLMEAADDICYAIIDLEDAVEMGILPMAEFEDALSGLCTNESTDLQDSSQRCAALRGKAVGLCIEEVSHQFILYEQALRTGQFPAKDLISVCKPSVKNALNTAKALAKEKIYQHKAKILTELAAFPCLGILLTTLIPATYIWVQQQGQGLSVQQALALQLLEKPLSPEISLYQAYMQVLDFIGSMTDNYAAKVARDISGLTLI
jgi:dGTPase